MDYLWTPWRYAYVTTAEKDSRCIFCELPNTGDDAKAHIVHRTHHCYIVLNTYPYTSGHVMIVPFAHVDELQKLSADAAHEMIELTQRMEGVLRQLYAPDGVNLGMNIGKAAGAGVAGHVHMHILPRWIGDTNFMTVAGESRVLPESLEITCLRAECVHQSETQTPHVCALPEQTSCCHCSSSAIPFSSITFTPNSFALSSLEPASAPATT